MPRSLFIPDLSLKDLKHPSLLAMIARILKTLIFVNVAGLTCVRAYTPLQQANLTSSSSELWSLFAFAQSWQPQFCHGQSSYVGCSTPDEFWKTSFTIHGLWPDVTTGKYPSHCPTDQFDLDVVTSAVPLDTLNKYWPNVKKSLSSSSYSSFWQHEWSTHGTCTGLDQATYFKTAVNLLINDPTPAFVGNNYGKSVSTASLRTAYGGEDQVVLQCSGKYLAQILTCWTKGSDNLPGARRACPSNLLKEDSCSSSAITISAF